ncbi:MAG: carbamoyltransferase HypF [Byssovorax cruenta]
MNKHILVKGIVEGVGFRPIVFELAARLELQCWVCSTDAGMEILAQGTESNIERFINTLKTETLGLVKIEDILTTASEAVSYPALELNNSTSFADLDQPLFADLGICPDCERELFDSRARRYLYPFISCSHCGPRFTTITSIPYQRSNTTLADFAVCESCNREYSNPNDRHFHDHQIACPECGPFVALREAHSQYPNSDSKVSSIECRTAAILKARRLLREGYILAIKGVGGFQLACDATNSFTVEELRDRKGRVDQPFTVMAANIEIVRSICDLTSDEEALLTSSKKPVVLLAKKQQRTLNVSRWVAPNIDVLAVMLPYTPLHHLLLNQTDLLLASEPVPPLLVMTGGSASGEPAAIENEDALHKLSSLADAFLLHNREIHIRCDDSVVRIDRPPLMMDSQGGEMINRPHSMIYIRRSHGYAPYAVKLPIALKSTLAVGGEMKNTVCLVRDQYALLSHQIGDLKKAEAFELFEQSVNHLSHIFHFQPELIAHDLHPEYSSTRYAQHLSKPCASVQHHHAHIVSCMADNGLDDKRVIGLCFDGPGYGTDDALWGGEVLLASFGDFERFAHLEYLRLPGSDSALWHPWRVAVEYSHALGMDIQDLPFLRNIGQQEMNVMDDQVNNKVDTPLTSSMGHLFDAVASLIGLRNEVTYEAQAAIELEALARPFVSIAQPYPYVIDQDRILRLRTMLQAIVQDVRAAKSIEIIAARFHRTIADMAIDVCKRARQSTGLNEVALSGDLWQNQILLNLVRDGLRRNEFVVYFHRNVPTNDSGLSLGQAVIANYARTLEITLADEPGRSER